MAIPDYETIMLPLLHSLADQKEHTMQEVLDILAEHFHLTPEERKELLPSGQQTVFYNRIGWARTYMKKAGIVDSTKRGSINITERGITVLKDNPQRLNDEYLMRFEEFKSFKKIPVKTRTNKTEKSLVERQDTPLEILENAFGRIRETLASDLLEQVKKGSPSLFERLVVELLVRMGYGGNLKDAGEAIGGVGDEGIDGIIKEDVLGLDIIYIQAKRWESNIGRPDIQKFAGALQGQRAKKGIFITTSSFSKDALQYVRNIESKIVLIDGERLASLMIDNNIGVNLRTAYHLKDLDMDYFTQER